MNGDKIKSVAIIGGTHGNELTGVRLVEHYQSHPTEVKRSSFSTQLILANPMAIQKGTRYVEKDLNRCFASASLNQANPNILEVCRAQEINQILGPKGSANCCDFIVDIHNSTACMGFSLIISRLDPMLTSLCASLWRKEPQLFKLYLMPESSGDAPYLPTISKRDLCLEIGDQAHGTVRADFYIRAKQCIAEILDFTEKWNTNRLTTPQELEVPLYQQWKNIDYPRRPDGSPAAMIAPNLQFKDYQPLHYGEPLFIDYSGNTTLWEGQTVYPVFINEHAYYEKSIAMSLTHQIKKTITTYDI
jgi:succinylglutamate desuccinylase